MLTAHEQKVIDRLKKTGIPPPTDARFANGAGKAWKGLPHSHLIEALLTEGKSRGISFVPSLHLSPSEGILAASLQAGEQMLGVLNDNTRRHSLRIYVGTALPQEYPVPLTRRILAKHTKGVSAQEVARETVEVLLADYSVSRQQRQEMRQRPVTTDLESNRVLMQAGRLGLMPWSRVGRVDALFSNTDGSYWDLLQSFARIAALNPPTKQMEQVWRFASLLP